MRHSIAVAVLLAASLCAARGAEIPKGAHLLLRMQNTISTRTAREGDYVYLRTAVPLVAGGRIVVPAGAYVQGVVAHVRRSGRISGRAQLGIQLETLTFASGRTFQFAPRLASVDSGDSGQKVEGEENLVQQGPGHGRDAQQIAIIAASGASIGGLAARSWKGAGIGGGTGTAVGLASVLGTRGKQVRLRRGDTLDVVFDRPVEIE
jgi:hypothetical protein